MKADELKSGMVIEIPGPREVEILGIDRDSIHIGVIHSDILGSQLKTTWFKNYLDIKVISIPDIVV